MGTNTFAAPITDPRYVGLSERDVRLNLQGYVQRFTRIKGQALLESVVDTSGCDVRLHPLGKTISEPIRKPQVGALATECTADQSLKGIHYHTDRGDARTHHGGGLFGIGGMGFVSCDSARCSAVGV